MADEQQPPIIKKVKKGQRHRHHGGAWKVAYADFVTAMMAFFLLMWLLNASSEEQRRGLSRYFGPPGDLAGIGGSGGVLSGLTIMSEGQLESHVSSGEGQSDGSEFGKKGSSEKQTDQEMVDSPEDVVQDDVRDGPLTALRNDIDTSATPDKQRQKEIEKLLKKGEKAIKQLDKRNFGNVKEDLKEKLTQDPALKRLAKNVVVDETPRGLRLQIVDQHNKSMFEIGKATPMPETQKLLAVIGDIIKKIPNLVSITGHTDARPYGSGRTYTNWELSADRANASRRILMKNGVKESRFAFITGKAATKPFIKQDPLDARNRRISIIIHRIPDSTPSETVN